MSDYEDNFKHSDSEQNNSDSRGDSNYEHDSDPDCNNDSNENDDEPYISPKRAKFDSFQDFHSSNTATNNVNDDKNDILSFPCSTGGKGERIMAKSGYQRGKGLGKNEQGIVEPVKASQQKGRSGFGYVPDEYEDEIAIDTEKEKISVYEEPLWLENSYDEDDVLTEQQLTKWLYIGSEKYKLHDEDHFCSSKVLNDVLEAKEKLDDVADVRKIRSRCNPFETIGKGIFLNRAAMKMANMDKVFDNMFTDPKDKYGNKIIGDGDLLYFADVCAGPGGFSEYVFYRKKWRAKGFGFTLVGENDFQLDKFFAGPCETFEAHYGVVPEDAESGDGDIFKSENMESFSDFVMRNTDERGVHFMMADGGFSADEKLYQEIISKQLYLCQCLVALKIVRTNGNFVVKLFDVFTPFSVGLIYLMYRSFDRISIHKPNSSRPANSERYLICQYKKEDCSALVNHLMAVNEKLCERFRTKRDVLELVPIDELKGDKRFFDYIMESNCRIGERQAYHLTNIVLYSKRPNAVDSRQESFKRDCLNYWDIPVLARTDPNKGEPASKLAEWFGNNSSDIESLYVRAKRIQSIDALSEHVKNILDWHWVVVGNEEDSEKMSFYLGLGKNNVYRLEKRRWSKLNNFPNFKLPMGTLIYGELVDEFVQSSRNVKSQYRRVTFHIIDGLFLGGEDIRRKHITERIKCCELFAKSLTKSTMIYRVKALYSCSDLRSVLSDAIKERKSKTNKAVFGFDIENDQFITPRGILFFCATNDDWSLVRSKTQPGNMYYHNKKTNESFWFKPHETRHHQICANFRTCFERRLAWWTDQDTLFRLSGCGGTSNADC